MTWKFPDTADSCYIPKTVFIRKPFPLLIMFSFYHLSALYQCTNTCVLYLAKRHHEGTAWKRFLHYRHFVASESINQLVIFVYALNQWETTLQCTVVSHWLGAYTKWSLISLIMLQGISAFPTCNGSLHMILHSLVITDHLLTISCFGMKSARFVRYTMYVVSRQGGFYVGDQTWS